MTVIPSRSTGSPNTAVARAATPIRSASCWTISDPSTSRETSEKVMGPTLQRDVPEREPALELRLERQLGPELRLQLELALVVALLRARCRHERVEEAALVVVDEVDRAALLLEGEDGGQHAVAVAARLERGGDHVDRHHEVLEVVVAQDDPAVAVVVAGGLDGRAGVARLAAQELLRVADHLLEVGRRDRLEREAGDVAVLEAEPGLERDLRGGHREQAIARRDLQLAAAAEERVEKAHYAALASVPWISAS